MNAALKARLEAWRIQRALRRLAAEAATLIPPECGCGNPACLFAILDAADNSTFLWQSAVAEYDPVRA